MESQKFISDFQAAKQAQRAALYNDWVQMLAENPKGSRAKMKEALMKKYHRFDRKSIERDIRRERANREANC